MAKKDRTKGGKSGGKAPWVMRPDGSRQRFLRGVVVHSLMGRGVDFDDAYAIADAARARLVDREVDSKGTTEVSLEQVRRAVASEAETHLGEDFAAAFERPVALRRDGPRIIARGSDQPFSRGLLARSIAAAGLPLDRAYTLVDRIERELREEGVESLASEELARRVAETLERHEGRGVARRYRLVRGVHRLPRPLVVYVGGASGTGKSTLAVELAPLLRTYRVTATDTVRQVMRMLFSPQILPALYGSSYATRPSAAQTLLDEILGDESSDEVDGVLSSFVEQSVRVSVGVRAVVERAITENRSVVVEGVHLFPPLVPFADLEGACYQVPLMLTTPDLEIHRTRFLARARFGGRRAERYLQNFDAIRSVQDFLLEQAEGDDVPLIDTTVDEPVERALRLVTSLLRRRLPAVLERRPEERVPALLLVIDGLADRPVRALGGRTPLDAASTPVLDRLAREGRTGLADPVTPGVVPDTAAGTLALFGQSPLALQRGPVEALGAGLSLGVADVALRGNLATLDPRGLVVDRRAGRVREEAEELADALDRLTLPGQLGDEVEVRVAPATEHRLAVVLRGEGLSAAIRGSDPGEASIPAPPLVPSPLDPADARAVHSAQALALFEQCAQEVLRRHPLVRELASRDLPPPNAILTRGAGHIHRLPPLEQGGERLKVTCVAGDRTILGIAGWLGAETVTGDEMTANLDTDLEAKFDRAREAIEAGDDLVVVHVKGADIAAHDLRPDRKVEVLERIDAALGRLLDTLDQPLRIAVGADHATLSETGNHAADPLPVIVWGPEIEADEVTTYGEQAAASGALGRFPLQLLLSRLWGLG